MRIVIDARYLDGTYTGIATYSRMLVEHLARVDQDNEYIVLVRPGFTSRLDLGDNFRLHNYAPRPVSIATMLALGRLVDSFQPDLLHSFFPIAPLTSKTPVMVTVHDMQPFVDPDFSARRIRPVQWAYNAFYRHVYPASLRRAKWALCDSYYTRDIVNELLPDLRAKLMVLTPGLDPDYIQPWQGDPEPVLHRLRLQGPYVLYYGSTRPNKNLPNQTRGFARYLSRTGDTTTTMVLVLRRDRFFHDLQRVIRAEGIEDRVRIIDPLAEDDHRAVLARASAFLFATKYEGFGFPALEAMAAGVPVLAGLSGALPEVCADAAEFANPDDPDSIATALAKLLCDTEHRFVLITRGRARATQFSWQEVAQSLRDIYNLLF
jgi:glycosyltransferase involved in cell wall biosynthesis